MWTSWSPRFNSKLNKYVSKTRNPQALVVDSLITWPQFILVYALFSMKSLLGLLCRIEEETVLVILIAPLWPKRTCCTDMLRLLVNEPCPLPNGSYLMTYSPNFRPASQSLALRAVETPTLKDRGISDTFHLFNQSIKIQLMHVLP